MDLEESATGKVGDGTSAIERRNVCIYGEGPKYVVFAHAFGMNQAIWDYLLPYFDESEFSIVLFDLMGAYGTPLDWFDLARHSTIHGFADDLLEILQELEVKQCSYVGHCISGMIGLVAAVESPDLFDKVILLNSSPRYLAAPDFEGFTLEELDSSFSALHANYLAWTTGETPTYGWRDVDSPRVLDLLKSLFLTRPDVALSLGKTLFQMDLREILPQITTRVHIIYCEDDPAVPQSAVEYLHHHLKLSCFVMLPPLGHAPHLTDPDVLGPVVARHLVDDGSLLRELNEDD